MALSSVIKTGHDSGTIVLKDGTGTPITLTVRFDRGDLSFDGLAEGLREVIKVVSRGKTRSLRKGAPTYPSFTFSAYVTEFSETGTGTLLDWIAKTTGTPFASRVSTAAALGDVDTTDVVLTMEGTTYGDGADHVIALEDCTLSLQFQETAEGNLFSLSGEVLGNITNGSGTTYLTAPRT